MIYEKCLQPNITNERIHVMHFLRENFKRHFTPDESGDESKKDQGENNKEIFRFRFHFR